MAFGSNGHRSRALSAALLLAVMAVAGCAAQPPAPPPPVVTSAPAERPAIPRPAPPPRPVDLHWAFTTTASSCTALASGPGGSLQIQADANRQLAVTARFTVPAHAIAPRARPARLNFSGPAGKLSLAGTWQNRAFSNKQRLDERAVADILELLGGGNATVSAGPLQLGTARLPAASVDGNAWVQCPKTLSEG